MTDLSCGFSWMRSTKSTLICLIGCIVGHCLTHYLLMNVWHLHLPGLWVKTIAFGLGFGVSSALTLLLMMIYKKRPVKKTLGSTLILCFFAMFLMMTIVDWMLSYLGAGHHATWSTMFIANTVGFVLVWPYHYFFFKCTKISCH